MVDFGNTVFEGQLSPSVPLVAPVEDKTSEYLAAGVKNTIDNVSSILFSNDTKAAKADAAKNSLFAEIAERVSMYADAREQGMSSDEISRRLRADSLAWVSNNPSMTEDIYTFQNKLLGENGLASNINRETPTETGQRKLVESGMANGWVLDTPAKVNNYKEFLMLGERAKQLDNQVKLLGESGAIASAQLKNEATLTLHGIVKTSIPWLNGRIETTNKLLAETTDTSVRQSIINKMKAEYAQQAAMIGANKAAGGDIDTTYLTKATDDIMTVWESTVNGTSDLAALETAQKTAETKATMIMYQTDPVMASWIALDKASKFTSPPLIQQLDQKKMDYLTKLAAPPTVNPDGSTSPNAAKPPDLINPAADVGLVTDTVKDSTKTALNDPTATPEETQAQMNKLNNAINSVNVYGVTDNDAKNFTSVVDLFADMSVGKFMEKNAAILDKGTADQAKKVIEKQYDSVILPLINDRWATVSEMVVQNPTAKDEWNRKMGLGPQSPGSSAEMDLTALIEPVWNGAGVEFRVKDEFSTDPNLRGIAKSLNQGPDAIAPHINRLVRAQAHLAGMTDYEKVYTELYAPRLFKTAEDGGVAFPPTVTGESDGDAKAKNTAALKTSPTSIDNPNDLKLTDFSEEELDKIIDASKAKDPEGMKGAGSPIDVAQAYLGMTETDSEQVKTLSAFISRNAGVEIDPAKTAWCAAFMDAVLGASGGKGTGKLNARSYLAWGVDVDKPQIGDVVVLKTGGKDDWTGHVGFYMGTNDDGTIKVLGGNQGDSVSEDNFNANNVLGFRRAG